MGIMKFFNVQWSPTSRSLMNLSSFEEFLAKTCPSHDICFYIYILYIYTYFFLPRIPRRVSYCRDVANIFFYADPNAQVVVSMMFFFLTQGIGEMIPNLTYIFQLGLQKSPRSKRFSIWTLLPSIHPSIRPFILRHTKAWLCKILGQVHHLQRSRQWCVIS